jgi:hypothetical protein
MAGNNLYLAILPFIYTSQTRYGLVEEALTLFPDREFATEFFPEEAEKFMALFKARAEKHLVGGHVVNYDVSQEPIPGGRVIVKVVQNVR